MPVHALPWRPVLTLDSRRATAAGSPQVLREAIRCGADLRIFYDTSVNRIYLLASPVPEPSLLMSCLGLMAVRFWSTRRSSSSTIDRHPGNFSKYHGDFFLRTANC